MNGSDVRKVLEAARTSVRDGQKVQRMPWRQRLIVNKEGSPRAILANAETALRSAPEWEGVLGFDEFALTTIALRPAPWGVVRGEWTDHHDRLTAIWLQHAAIYASVEIAGQAVQTVAKDRPFHPVRSYLDGLKWDGTNRIDDFLNLYVGAEPSDYVRAVGARWLISAVARIYNPGCKVDTCLILEGPQGIRKSTAIRTLAGEWFTDEICEFGSKDAALQTAGVWMIELAELDSLSRGDTSRIKAFMSRAADRYRPPYGKRLVEAPRQCVFAGTVNHNQYLRDETGARRFWPVRCGRILIDHLERDRDQLFAEAIVRHKAGCPWWLDSDDLTREAEEEQQGRYEGDPWDGLIRDWASARENVSVEQVLQLCIEKTKDQWTQVDRNRVARSLRSLGWERFYARYGSDREWRYRRRSQ